MHIVIAGETELAIRIAEALMDEHDVVLVTTDITGAARVDNFDGQVVQGSASSLATLREARTDRADYFVAASASDERNIVGCIAAVRLGAKRRICVMNMRADPEIDALDDMSLASSVDIDSIVRPAEQLTQEILRIVKVPGALDVRTFHNNKIGLLRALVEDGSDVTSQSLGEWVPSGVRVVMVHRGHEHFTPGAGTTLMPDDRVTMMGQGRRLVRFVRQRFRSPHHQKEKRRAMICGGGAVGLSVARGLREAGWWVKMIEKSEARCEYLSEQLNCLVLHGDGSDIDLLREEHAETTAALIAVTNNDEKNLLISLIAKQLGVERIITRADKQVNEHIFDRAGIDVVLSTRGAALRSVVSQIASRDEEHLAELERGQLSVLELELPPSFPVTPLSQMTPPTVAAVGAIMRGTKAVFPTDDTELRPGDHLLIVVRAHEEAETKRFFVAPPSATSAGS